ncbi:MAG: acyl--CoA ligase [Oscillospiraceae bacterium]|nr:acyl--CoA ligase [Oscillospiraceae bacterium]
MFTVYDLFRSAVQDYPDSPAIICQDCSLNYKELDDQVNTLTDSLLRWGIGKGDRVGIYYPNSTLYPVLLYALNRIGAVFVPFNTRLNKEEIVSLINLTDCQFIIFDTRFGKTGIDASEECPDVKMFIPGCESGILSCKKEAPVILAPGECIERSPEDEGLIIFTGGTTSSGSGVIVTQGALTDRVTMKFRDDQRTVHSDIMLNHAPLFHTGGLSLMIQTLSAGGCFVMSEKLDPDAIVSDCEKYRITQLAMIPPSNIYRIEEAQKRLNKDLSSVSLCIMAGGKTDPEIAEKTFSLFPNTKLYLNYGSSENAITLGHIMSRKDSMEKPWRLNSSGVPNMQSFIRLLDEDGNEVPVGESGEAWGKSPAMMKSYLSGQTPFANGWFPTGDIFRKDEDGFYYFICRKKNMIKSGGENVFAEEVEAVIKEYPPVKDCVVFGLSDRQYGELVSAAIICSQGEHCDPQELLAFCREKIASYKKPRKIFFVEEFPVSAVGKISRRKLVDMLKAQEPDYSI